MGQIIGLWQQIWLIFIIFVNSGFKDPSPLYTYHASTFDIGRVLFSNTIHYVKPLTF